MGIFSVEENLTRGLRLTKLPHPWGKLSTLLHAFYNPPGRPVSRPLGPANDLCSYCMLHKGMGSTLDNIVAASPDAV